MAVWYDGDACTVWGMIYCDLRVNKWKAEVMDGER